MSSSHLLLHRPRAGINRVTRTVFDDFTQEIGVGIANITPLIQAMEYMLTAEVDGG